MIDPRSGSAGGFAPRAERLRALESTVFDILIVGGGITGAGVARDAASRGLSVGIVDRGDWGSGTSWRSTKLVHGGLRYLRQGRIGLVFESLSERALLLERAPHLVRPLEFLFAILPGRWVSPASLSAGLALYDLLSLGRGAPRHRRLSSARAAIEEPLLAEAGVTGGAVYSDASADDARLTLENVLDAAQLGAVAVSRAESRGWLRGADGRTAGAAVHDLESDREIEVRARVSIDATGPWSDEGRRREDPSAAPRLRLSKGAHITVPAARLPLRRAVAVPVETGRLFFAIPSGPVTLLGTTESDYAGAVDAVSPSESDVAYILARAGEAFPRTALGGGDAIAAFAGVRPLRVEPGRGASSTSREEAIETAPGLVSVTGGKLTTHRRMGGRTVDAALRLVGGALRLGGGMSAGRSETAGRRFPGAPDGGASGLAAFTEDLSRRAEAMGISPALVRHLAARYGVRAEGVVAILEADPSSSSPLVEGLPDCEAEVRFAVRHEDARRASDVLIRRTHLFWQAPGQAASAVSRVHAILDRELGRDPGRQERSASEFAAELDRSRSAISAATALPRAGGS